MGQIVQGANHPRAKLSRGETSRQGVKRLGGKTSSYHADEVLGVIILSICLSVARMLCDKTKRCNADILIPHETAMLWVGDAPFNLKFALKVTRPHKITVLGHASRGLSAIAELLVVLCFAVADKTRFLVFRCNFIIRVSDRSVGKISSRFPGHIFTKIQQNLQFYRH